ncbi:ABC transporter ATP-binding protein [candidate division KSB1 bacterium]|nr:ABC transporter ATP-binding protein [candidate division KSB1 bacterium]RQW00201.1 MAG: ABC transporter ATP-binding protein [candidate division KSB1 bacterium]
MKLYFRILSYIKPHWKAVLIGIFFTQSYILFHTTSLWVAIDFVSELFATGPQSAITSDHHEQSNSREDALAKQLGTQDLYDKLNTAIKSILIQENKYRTLQVVCLVIFLSFFFKNLSLYAHHVFFYFVQLKIVIQLRNDLQRTLLRLPLSFFHKEHSGTLTSIVFNDVNAIQTVLDSSFVKMFLSPLQIIFNLILLMIISWKLTLITFLIIPVSGFLIVKIGQSMRRKIRRMLEQISLVVTAFQESISAIRIVKAFTAEKKESEKFADTNYSYYKKAFRAKRLDYLTSPLNETIGVLVFTILLWFGGGMVYRGDGMTAEIFMRFLIFLYMLFQPLKELSGLNNVLQSGMAAAERIFTYLDTPTEVYEVDGAIDLDGFYKTIAFSNVNFSYNGETPVLRDINLVINKGEMVAFVGHSGVGKSTLVDLIPRFYDVTNGSITIDGHDVRDIRLLSLRSQIGIVTQETILFNDTIRNNISYGGKVYSDEQIINAAKNANAWEFIENTEKSLDTVIGERGVTISGGQRQRLSIARAILKNRPILILDEATSALDTQSEKLVQRAIDNLMHNRTVLAIAHRLSTILHADKIVVMDKGRIVDVGKHEELLGRSTVYAQLYNMQFLSDTQS